MKKDIWIVEKHDIHEFDSTSFACCARWLLNRGLKTVAQVIGAGFSIRRC